MISGGKPPATSQNGRKFGLFGVERSERGWVLAFGAVLLGNSLATQVSGIVAVSGFLNQVGVAQLIVVWAIDYALIMFLSGLESLVVDRFDRRQLIGWVSLGFGLLFVVLRLIFAFNAPSWLSYSLLYLVADQQWLFFPLVFWLLAEDTCHERQAERLFPFMSSLGFIGKIVGIALAAITPVLLPSFGVSAVDILDVNAVIYVFMYLVVRTRLTRLPAHSQNVRHEDLRDRLLDGWQFVRKVPAFRYLAVSILAMVACDIMLEFRFYAVSDTVFSTTSSYQEFYSAYRLLFALAGFAVEGFLARPVIFKLGLKNTFLILPISALAGGVWMLIAPGLASALGGMVLQKLPQSTIDETARKDLETLVPPDRRGRVSILMDSYLFAAGSLIGCLLLGVVVVCEIELHLPWLFYVYLAAAVVAASCSLTFILRMRKSYEASLLSGWMARRKRASSVLDRLSF